MQEESASSANEAGLDGSHAMSNWSWNMHNIQTSLNSTHNSNNLSDGNSVPSNAGSSASSTSGHSEDGGMGSGDRDMGN